MLFEEAAAPAITNRDTAATAHVVLGVAGDVDAAGLVVAHQHDGARFQIKKDWQEPHSTLRFRQPGG